MSEESVEQRVSSPGQTIWKGFLYAGAKYGDALAMATYYYCTDGLLDLNSVEETAMYVGILASGAIQEWGCESPVDGKESYYRYADKTFRIIGRGARTGFLGCGVEDFLTEQYNRLIVHGGFSLGGEFVRLLGPHWVLNPE